MSALDLAPIPITPGSDDDSLVFDDISSSEGVPSPSEHVVHLSLRSPRASSGSYDAVKGIASVGVAVHAPPPCFVGTPFATGPTTLFEYPFPTVPSRPSLSNASSLSSVSSGLHGPPSPSTRAKFHPHPLSRLSSKASHQQSTRRRFSGGNGPPPIRVPPRLRTDSGSSVASSLVEEPIITNKPSPASLTSVPHSAPGPSSQLTPRPNSPLSQAARSLPLLRLRNRSGSLGVLPIQLPPPTITSIRTIGQLNASAGPVSPAMVVGAMTSPGFGVPKGMMAAAGFGSALRMTPTSSDQGAVEEGPSAERRRASVPSLFTFGNGELGEERENADGLEGLANSTPTDWRAKDEKALGSDLAKPDGSQSEVERNEGEGGRWDPGDVGDIGLAGIDLGR